MTIRELERSVKSTKTFNLDPTVVGALRTAAYQEDRTMSDIVDTALAEWLTRFGYMAIEEPDTECETDRGINHA